MQLMTLKEIRHAVPPGPLEARVHVQLESVAAKFTREQKPYCELTLADAADRMTLRVWSDSPNYKACDSMQTRRLRRDHRRILSASTIRPRCPPLAIRARSRPRNKRISCKARQRCARSRQPIGNSLSRPPRRSAIRGSTRSVRRVHRGLRDALPQHRRRAHLSSRAPRWPGRAHRPDDAGRARKSHRFIQDLNLDLLVAGILFHDSGKLWENYLPETGFSMPFDELGEMVGHIGIGLELVNSLWRKIQTDDRATSNGRSSASADGGLPTAPAASDRLASRRAAVRFAGLSEDARSARASITSIISTRASK